MNVQNQDRGAVLIAALILAVIVAMFCMTSLVISHTESRGTYASIQRDKAFFVASAGLHDEVKALKDVMAAVPLKEPFKAFHAMAGQHTIQQRPLMSNGMVVGEYDVVVDSVAAVDAWNRDVTITATGSVPFAGHPQAVTRTVSAVIRVGIGRSEVFDYVYFINNWGWYYGNTIIANGNIRANGQFDFGGYRPYVNGMPRFSEIYSGVFGAAVDQGGVYAGWDIKGSENVQGRTSEDEHMHAFGPPIPMPNLTDMTLYEETAKQKSANIKIGGVQMCNAVVGDEPGEKPRLFLKGTVDDPIELDGPIVVKGDLIIQGYVRGKGALYVQGNIYIAGNIVYSNPIEPPPEDPSKSNMEEWIKRNESADALGLFARQHIIAGDYQHNQWRYQVQYWMKDHRNRSDEDAGEDGIPNTRAGRDGLPGTADDDILEDDKIWTVRRYTKAHGDAGLIPAGRKVGDGIPETGEDIDGDGVYDPGAELSDFDMGSRLKDTEWSGNFPAGEWQYRELCGDAAGLEIDRLDAAFYTNHAFALLTLDSDRDLIVNGCVVSRNESIIYGTKHAVFNYDLRLLQENNPHALDLPKTWKPLRMVMWRSD